MEISSRPSTRREAGRRAPPSRILGERIRQARQLRALSLRALAERADLSAQAISKYELGKSLPSSGSLLKLARALDLSVEVFVRPPQLRKLTADGRRHGSKRQESRLAAGIRDWLERYLEIESLRSAQTLSPPWPAGFPRAVSSLAETEDAAGELREAWHLGRAPIVSVTEVLEDHGLKIALVDNLGAEARTFTAVADRSLPVIVTRRGLTRSRQRLVLARELARFLVEARAQLDAEAVYRRFAAAFLVPAAAVRFELGARRKSLGAEELESLERKYGLAREEWLQRAVDLGILAPSRLRAARRGLVRDDLVCEPEIVYPAEQPSRFRRLVMQAVAEGVISEKRAREISGRSFDRPSDPSTHRSGEEPFALRG